MSAYSFAEKFSETFKGIFSPFPYGSMKVGTFFFVFGIEPRLLIILINNVSITRVYTRKLSTFSIVLLLRCFVYNNRFQIWDARTTCFFSYALRVVSKVTLASRSSPWRRSYVNGLQNYLRRPPCAPRRATRETKLYLRKAKTFNVNVLKFFFLMTKKIINRSHFSVHGSSK